MTVIPHAWNHEQNEGGRCQHPSHVTGLESECQLMMMPRGEVSAYVVVNIEILRQGITAGRYSFVVRDLGRVIQTIE